jgi:hypothetical protein
MGIFKETEGRYWHPEDIAKKLNLQHLWTGKYKWIHSFIHLLKFHRILTRLRQPVEIKIGKKESKT